MKKLSISLLLLLCIPAVCFSSDCHITIGCGSYYVGQQSREILSNFNSCGDKYKIGIDNTESGPERNYYISERDSNLIVGVLKIRNGKINQITRHWTRGKSTPEEVGRALYESIKEYILVDGTNAKISTDESSNPDMTVKDIEIKGKKSSVRISTVETRGDKNATTITIYDTVGK